MGKRMKQYNLAVKSILLSYLKCNGFLAPFFGIRTLYLELFRNHLSKLGRDLKHLRMTFFAFYCLHENGTMKVYV